MGGRRKLKRAPKGERTRFALKSCLQQLDRYEHATSRDTQRDARARALALLRRAREQLDEEYPTKRKKPRRTGRLTAAAKIRRYREEDRYQVAVGSDLHRACKQAGIAARPDPKRNSRVWVPHWTDLIWRLSGERYGRDHKARIDFLRRCHKSLPTRRREVADATLRCEPAS